MNHGALNVRNGLVASWGRRDLHIIFYGRVVTKDWKFGKKIKAPQTRIERMTAVEMAEDCGEEENRRGLVGWQTSSSGLA